MCFKDCCVFRIMTQPVRRDDGYVGVAVFNCSGNMSFVIYSLCINYSYLSFPQSRTHSGVGNPS